MLEKKEKDNPRILIVTGVLWVGGGAEKVAAMLGNYFTDQGYETHLLTFYEAPEKYPYHGVYHTLNEQPKKNRLSKIWNIPVRIWRIRQYARAHNIDTIFSFLEEANFYVLVMKMLFARRMRVIVSVRNNIRRRGWFFRTISRMLYPYAAKVVSNTRSVERMLIEDFGLTNTASIYNPLDMDMIEKRKQEPLASEFAWLSSRSPLCISIGRLIHQKGQWHLIRAFTWVVKAHPHATLIILGEGEYQRKLEDLIKDCDLSEHVFLIGKHANVYQFLQQADMFVFSSLWEGMPNTMLEALAVGLPIVSTDCVSGPREIIAPDANANATEKLTYPHRTTYGVLTEPFAYDACWESPERTALTDSEIQLADAIRGLIDEGWKRGELYTAYLARTKDFAYEKVMQEWRVFLR